MAENETIFAPILHSELLIATLYEETRDLQTVADLMNSHGSNAPDRSTFIHTAAYKKRLLKNTVLGPENCAGLRATTPLVSNSTLNQCLNIKI
jgi:hypothetical protein